VTKSNAPGNALPWLSGRERRRWCQAERRALRQHEAWQLATLRNLAATGGRLTALACQTAGGYTSAAEFIIDGKRILVAPVHRPTLCALAQAFADMPAVPLLAASRYGPCWVLTFEVSAAPLVLLAGRLSIDPASPPTLLGPARPPRHPTARTDRPLPAPVR
jgi:hypothetical protein